jgi:DNA-binding HxlR family transcriptional regulator
MIELLLRRGSLSGRSPGVTQKMLIQQLRELEGDGVVTRTVYPEVPPALNPSEMKPQFR